MADYRPGLEGRRGAEPDGGEMTTELRAYLAGGKAPTLAPARWEYPVHQAPNHVGLANETAEQRKFRRNWKVAERYRNPPVIR
jgi:hypothetical protein